MFLALASIPSALSRVVHSIVVSQGFLSGQEPNVFSLAYYMSDPEQGMAFNLLNHFDILTIWTFVLVLIGVKAAAKSRPSFATWVAFCNVGWYAHASNAHQHDNRRSLMNRALRRFDGKIALITGAGSGIGYETALAMASEGADLVLTELPGLGFRVQQLIERCQEFDAEVLSLSLDLKNHYAIEQVVDTAASHFGQIDILVNNAGTQILKPAFDLEVEEFDLVMSVNLRGSFLCAQAVGRMMVDYGGGTIVNVASQHGVVGNRDRAPYCASKAGLINLTRALAIEWAEHSIRVNAISPTFVRNGNNDALLASPEIQSEISRGVLLGRPANADEVASGIMFLASDDAKMITGHNLMIDGGWTAH